MRSTHWSAEPPSPAEIRAFRERWGLTQAALAYLLGIKSGVVTISAWENGRATPQPYLRHALAHLAVELERQRAHPGRELSPEELEAGMRSELERLRDLLGDPQEG